MNKSRLTLRALTEGAIFIALAVVVGKLKLFELPQGGSINLAMLPIFIYCARWGLKSGMLVSFVYSLLKLSFDGAYAWGWQSIVGDYIVAFTVLGLAGLFHAQKYGFFTGSVVGALSRFLVHYVVGATVWAEYMPETFFGMTMHSPWFYSLLYNGSFILIDLALCLLLGLAIWKPMGKYIRGEDLPTAR
jgi:Predicted membrane protein